MFAFVCLSNAETCRNGFSQIMFFTDVHSPKKGHMLHSVAQLLGSYSFHVLIAGTSVHIANVNIDFEYYKIPEKQPNLSARSSFLFIFCLSKIRFYILNTLIFVGGGGKDL